jgi:hypothetical protein
MEKMRIFKPNPHGKKKGFIDQFIAALMTIFIIIVAFLQSIEPLRQSTIHNELFDLTNMALLKCESDGGLTVDTQNFVLAQAIKYNLDPNLITFVCKINDVETQPLKAASSYPSDSSYGSKITLTINYNYTWHQTKLIGFTSSQGTLKTSNLGTTLSTTTKN